MYTISPADATRNASADRAAIISSEPPRRSENNILDTQRSAAPQFSRGTKQRADLGRTEDSQYLEIFPSTIIEGTVKAMELPILSSVNTTNSQYLNSFAFLHPSREPTSSNLKSMLMTRPPKIFVTNINYHAVNTYILLSAVLLNGGS
jgi:hypothetical protein